VAGSNRRCLGSLCRATGRVAVVVVAFVAAPQLAGAVARAVPTPAARMLGLDAHSVPSVVAAVANPAQLAKAQALALSDSDVASAIAKSSIASISTEGIYTADDTAVYGGLITLAFSRPIDIDATLPGTGAPAVDGDRPGPVLGRYHLVASNVSQLLVAVNLHTLQVESVLPSPADTGVTETSAYWIQAPQRLAPEG
jgi:hypothetical protein